MDTTELQKWFLQRVEDASGKPILVQCDPNFSGHATIRIARDNQPAHLFQYKKEHEAVLPYLVAFQCLLALRTIEANQNARFDLSSKPNMIPDVLRLVQDHLRTNSSVPSSAVPQLANQFGNGLGWQLRSIPVAIRVDQEIYDQHSELRPFQRTNIEQQLQENMSALSPKVKTLAPKQIIDANASMSTAFAMFWTGLWDEPTIAMPFISAGYNQVGMDLLALNASIPSDPNHDKELVDAWAKRVGLDCWFETISR